ncbi:hypothetical protein BDV23DRAFT_95564 [Aspergillus alliaceus]|uniref:Uncharacterized protein n=1 Tax=Petromyces alliaceus TaxID=209559 RepID=A0A5N7CMK3_PETAA|nr:hypothetical protein BDV23DRAFT_95564 [Aspergillus alliaceus]
MVSKYLFDFFWSQIYCRLKEIMNDLTTRVGMIAADFFVAAVVNICVEYNVPVAVACLPPSRQLPVLYIPGRSGSKLPGTTTLEHLQG